MSQKRVDINKDVSVWAQLLLKDGEVNVLGHTRYESKNHTFLVRMRVPKST